MSVSIISELCGQWGGAIDKAKRMIDESAESGADAVKVQIYDTYQMPGDNRSKWEYLSMSQEVFLELKEYSEKLGVDYFASAFHQDRFDWILNSGLKVNKIASMLIESDFDLCIKMLESGLKTYCSLGKWNKEHLPFKNFNNVEILWASTREPYNYIQAKKLGCKIITAPPSIIEKIENFKNISDKNLSISTVKGFLKDSKLSKFKI